MGNSFKLGCENKFEVIPSVIPFLLCLKELGVMNVGTLKSLDRGLFNLPNLEILDCNHCVNLQSPPYEVCEQGLGAMKKYYVDMEKGTGRNMPTISAAVIGSKMAGKTSLIWTLQRQTRTLSHRNALGVKDDTTEAFNVEELELGGYPLKIFDFGGHKIYHIAYQLLIRKNYIPIIVVNMDEFAQISLKEGSKEAARQLCMDFLSHLYLTCPLLGAPILVLTHKDCFVSPEAFDESKKDLLKFVEELRSEMVEEEELMSRQDSALLKILHFVSRDRQLFSETDIYVFENAENLEVIQELRSALDKRCCIDTIPKLWEKVLEYLMQQGDKLFLELSEISLAFPGDEGHYILRYLHNIGKILWFEREPSLKNIVFHRIEIVTEVITRLYHHRSGPQWESYVLSAHSYRCYDEFVSEQRYRSLVKSFRETGILDKAVLYQIYEADSHRQRFPFETALHLLKTFYLVCGPITRTKREKFILPYFSPFEIRMQPTTKIRLKIDILFVGLTPPSYVYNLLTVVYLNFFDGPVETDRITVAHNGAELHRGHIVSRVIHDWKARSLTVQADTDSENISKAWKTVMLIVDTILKKVLLVWVAARPICRFFCAHCLLLGAKNPDIMEDPEWYQLPNTVTGRSPMSNRLENFHGERPVPCLNDNSIDGSLTVPMALRFPCKPHRHKFLYTDLAIIGFCIYRPCLLVLRGHVIV